MQLRIHGYQKKCSTQSTGIFFVSANQHLLWLGRWCHCPGLGHFFPFSCVLFSILVQHHLNLWKGVLAVVAHQESSCIIPWQHRPIGLPAERCKKTSSRIYRYQYFISKMPRFVTYVTNVVDQPHNRAWAHSTKRLVIDIRISLKVKFVVCRWPISPVLVLKSGTVKYF